MRRRVEYPCNRSQSHPNGSYAPPSVVTTPGPASRHTGSQTRPCTPPLRMRITAGRPYHIRLSHLCLFRNEVRAFPHLIGLRYSACPCCLHAAPSFSTLNGSPYRWTCWGVYARPGIGVNLSWESRGGEVCGTRGLDGTAVAATGSRFPPGPYGGQRLPAQKPCAGRPGKDHRTITTGPPEAGGCCVPSRIRHGAGAPAYGGQPVLQVAQAGTVVPAAGLGQQKADAAQVGQPDAPVAIAADTVHSRRGQE